MIDWKLFAKAHSVRPIDIRLQTNTNTSSRTHARTHAWQWHRHWNILRLEERHLCTHTTPHRITMNVHAGVLMCISMCTWCGNNCQKMWAEMRGSVLYGSRMNLLACDKHCSKQLSLAFILARTTRTRALSLTHSHSVCVFAYIAPCVCLQTHNHNHTKHITSNQLQNLKVIVFIQNITPTGISIVWVFFCSQRIKWIFAFTLTLSTSMPCRGSDHYRTADC